MLQTTKEPIFALPRYYMNIINRALLLNTIGLLITSSILIGQRYMDIPDSIAIVACCIALVCIVAGIIISIRTIIKKREE